MKRKEMTLEDAIELLRSEYEKAKRTKYVINPLAWALYHTWKKVHNSTGGRDDKREAD